MLTTKQALKAGYKWKNSYWSYKFGDGYELCFEPLIWNNQMYVALYKDMELLTEKVVVMPGYEVVKAEYKKEVD